MEQVQIEVSHVLSDEQLNQIRNQVTITLIDAIQKARNDVGLDNDLMYSKAELRRFLNDCSDNYVEELLSKGLPKGRSLSERKTVFSKKQVRAWMLENEEQEEN